MLGLVLPYYTDAGVIVINDFFFQLVDSRSVEDEAEDDDLPIADAICILRFMFQILDLGAGDAVIRGAAVQDLVEVNFPRLLQLLTDPEYGVPPPRDSRLDYSRFCQNFRHLNVSIFTSCKGNTICVLGNYSRP